jgi:hypothetical protein
LTSGEQGATHSPIFSNDGTKVAYLELDEDGYESDRAKIVIYDLKKDIRFTITQEWDRSPSYLAVRIVHDVFKFSGLTFVHLVLSR